MKLKLYNLKACKMKTNNKRKEEKLKFKICRYLDMLFEENVDQITIQNKMNKFKCFAYVICINLI